MLESRALILTKVETTYGVDATPTATSDAILTTKPTIELITEDKNREVVLPYFGSLASIPLATGIKISFGVEVRGSGTATTPPKIGALLRACGFTQTVGASYVTYAPNSAQDIESVTIYFYNDGILYKALGCVGNSVILNAKANDKATLEFEFQGMFGGTASFATTQTFPTPTYGDASSIPVFRNASFSFGSLSSANAIIEALEINISNKITKRPDANSTYGVKRYSNTGREVKGSFDPEVIALSSWNPWSIYENGTTGTLSASIGESAGNRLVITANNCQISAPKLGARDGIATYSIEFNAVITTSVGNNEIELKFN